MATKTTKTPVKQAEDNTQAQLPETAEAKKAETTHDRYTTFKAKAAPKGRYSDA